MTARKKVLFIAEAVALSHVGRILAVAAALKDLEADFHFAFDKRYAACLPESSPFTHLATIPTEKFFSLADRLQFTYSQADLEEYVDDELRLFDSVNPDLIIGDFRITLAISARKKGIPYFNVINCYWLPEFPAHARLPDHAFLRPWPESLSKKLFDLAGPAMFRLMAVPFNRAARACGVPSAEGSLQKVFTQADHSFIAEPEEWAASMATSVRTVVGPMEWRPRADVPSWLGRVDWTRPTIYVNMGSSGSKSVFSRVLEATRGMNIQLVFSGLTEAEILSYKRPDVLAARFISNSDVLKNARLFISNGGSLSMCDALRYGKPIIGATSNYDQFLSASLFEAKGVGRQFHSNGLSAGALRAAVAEFLTPDERLRESLDRARTIFLSGLKRSAIEGVVREALFGRGVGR